MRESNSKLKDTTKRIVQKKYNRCFECGSTFGLSYSHILKKIWYEDYNDPDNIVLDCMDCHHIWDNGTFVQKAKMNSLEKRIEIIKAIQAKTHGGVQRRITSRLEVLRYGFEQIGLKI